MLVRSFSTPGKFYWTTPARCSCPQFVYRLAERGGHCKHQRLVNSIYDYASAWSNRKLQEEVKTYAPAN